MFSELARLTYAQLSDEAKFVLMYCFGQRLDDANTFLETHDVLFIEEWGRDVEDMPVAPVEVVDDFDGPWCTCCHHFADRSGNCLCINCSCIACHPNARPCQQCRHMSCTIREHHWPCRCLNPSKNRSLDRPCKALGCTPECSCRLDSDGECMVAECHCCKYYH